MQDIGKGLEEIILEQDRAQGKHTEDKSKIEAVV
jgi:hypothetical protein